MTNNFSFNFEKYDFWAIYEAIKKYYPIGIPRREKKGIYMDYSGHKAMEKLLIDCIHNNYESFWTGFEKHLGAKFEKEVKGTTLGQAPSFSSSIILNKKSAGDCLHLKELHFSISLLGDFYQIYGIDKTVIQSGINRYAATNVVTVSPFEEFHELFISLAFEIEKKFPSTKIVPYSISQSIISGLEVSYLDDKDCSVNKALFNDYLDTHSLNGFIGAEPYISPMDSMQIKYWGYGKLDVIVISNFLLGRHKRTK